MFNNTHFPRAKKFWYMGKLYDWSQPVMHTMSHALHYGTSVFEGIRAYETSRGPAVFRLAEHVDRFLHSASTLFMKSPYNKKEIIDAIKSVIRKNKFEAAYIRPLLYYSYGNLGLVPKFSPVELTIGAWEWPAYLGDRAKKGVRVCISPWRRIHRSQLEMTAKLGGVYVQSTISGMFARSLGFDEALFLNLEGNVAEGPGENIFIIKDRTLITNNKRESVLEGITRTSLLQVAKDLGYKTRIQAITKKALFHADEAFFSGTAVEIAPIVYVEDCSVAKGKKKGCSIGSGKPGEITLHLFKTFHELVRGKIKKYEKWLTYVYD